MVTIDSKLNAVPFHEKEYWERRFEKESHFEWLLTWSDIEQHVTPYLKDQKTILHLGKKATWIGKIAPQEQACLIPSPCRLW